MWKEERWDVKVRKESQQLNLCFLFGRWYGYSEDKSARGLQICVLMFPPWWSNWNFDIQISLFFFFSLMCYKEDYISILRLVKCSSWINGRSWCASGKWEEAFFLFFRGGKYFKQCYGNAVRPMKNRNAAESSSFTWDVQSSLPCVISLESWNCCSILDQFILIW